MIAAAPEMLKLIKDFCNSVADISFEEAAKIAFVKGQQLLEKVKSES